MNILRNGRGTCAEVYNTALMQHLSVNYKEIKAYQCTYLGSEESYW